MKLKWESNETNDEDAIDGQNLIRIHAVDGRWWLVIGRKLEGTFVGYRMIEECLAMCDAWDLDHAKGEAERVYEELKGKGVFGA